MSNKNCKHSRLALGLHRPDFSPNFVLPRHGWYRFKEGFSATLVMAFINEHMPESAGSRLLDPFLGSGTTAVEGARLGLHVHGVEINPFMEFLSRVKTRDYSSVRNLEAVALECLAGKVRARSFSLANDTTLVERRGLKKWLFNRDVAVRFEQIRTAISKVSCKFTHDLLLLALIASVENVANARKDGKCWRYKANWQEMAYDSRALDDAFAAMVLRYARDIEECPRLSGGASVTRADARESIGGDGNIAPFDGVLTSPPYLNSFDYTDIYRPELLLLKHAENARELRKLRFGTIRSHVQVAWEKSDPLDIPLLRRKIKEIEGSTLWCGRIPEMVNAYFVDIDRVIQRCVGYLRNGARAGFVVADSAYCGVVIPVSKILAEILERNGLAVLGQSVLRQTLGNGNHQQRSEQRLNEILTVARFSGKRAVLAGVRAVG